MMPAEHSDYSGFAVLGRILQDHRIRDTKYSGPRQKRLKISINYGQNIFHASIGFLRTLEEKYGPQTSFNDAFAQWEAR